MPELKIVRIASVGVCTIAPPRRLNKVFMIEGTVFGSCDPQHGRAGLAILGPLVSSYREYQLLLAEGQLTRRLFGSMLRRIAVLPLPSG